MYLMIENPGEAQPEAFTLLGASTSRNSGNNRIIGKFGTGNKNSIATLLRHNVFPTAMCGTRRMDFNFVEQDMEGSKFRRVIVKYNGKRSQELGFVVEHGEIDWDKPEMALREFVSNAIDRAIVVGERIFAEKHPDESIEEYRKTAKDYEKILVSKVDAIRGKSGTTRVFIPMNDTIENFISNFNKWFLHFSDPLSLNKKVLEKTNRNFTGNTAVIYRKGVFVREVIMPNNPSLFDYNIDDLPIDDCRKVDDWIVKDAAAKALAASDQPTLSKFFISLLNGKVYWEHGFDSYSMNSEINDKQKTNWQDAFKTIKNGVACRRANPVNQIIEKKGYQVVEASEGVYESLHRHGVMTPEKIVSNHESMGTIISETRAEAVVLRDKIWDLVCSFKMNDGKQKPDVKCFKKAVSANNILYGYTDKDVIFLNEDHVSLPPNRHILTTVLEEIDHYVTGATDCSKDFQQWLLDLCASMMEKTLQF